MIDIHPIDEIKHLILQRYKVCSFKTYQILKNNGEIFIQNEKIRGKRRVDLFVNGVIIRYLLCKKFSPCLINFELFGGCDTKIMK